MQSHQPLGPTALLPSPTLTLTIPSLNDGTILSCRVYHPSSSSHSPSPSPSASHSPVSARKRAAILTHPYAPLGGCQDDPVLDAVGSKLLQDGYVIGTLDFRGAGSSQGRTSWTGKAEGDDLASFAGFMAYYMHFLTPENSIDAAAAAATAATIGGHHQIVQEKPPLLLFVGYSMGALTTANVPPLPHILRGFRSPSADSHAAQLRLRAEALAAQHNIFTEKLREERAAAPHHGEPASPDRHVRVGGDESPRRSTGARKSHDGKHRRIPSLHETEEKLKRRVSLMMHRPMPPPPQQKQPPPAGCLPPVEGFASPSPAYVLISRPHGLLAHLATMTVLPTAVSSRRQTPEETAAERKLVENPTLMVFGTADGMFPASKSRAVASRLEGMVEGGKMFRTREVEGAGHFWLEEGVLQELREIVGEFGSEIFREVDG